MYHWVAMYLKESSVVCSDMLDLLYHHTSLLLPLNACTISEVKFLDYVML